MLNLKRELRQNYSPALRLAVISLVLCGLVFPLVITGIAQVFLPSQANGSLVQLHGKNVGSGLIAQNFSLPFFFHPRNDSASGVDPDITVQDAYSQIPRINAATGISADMLQQIVNQNEEGTFWIFGTLYVNVLRLNLVLIQTNNPAYKAFQ
ncbi:MAG TPA: potassium-transporting ATPase subunit C [Candidatus Sulfotelmatobacter sp.]|jgi:K+-transporting ATPase ATPase C chain|nr:potassium-transporting ATPase subunit C [Candidatus Sulfotelmatobacter sp.]